MPTVVAKVIRRGAASTILGVEGLEEGMVWGVARGESGEEVDNGVGGLHGVQVSKVGHDKVMSLFAVGKDFT